MSDYYTIPSLVDSDECTVVENFIIGRVDHGEILFPGKIELTGIDIAKTVHINRKNVVIYPDDSEKPPVGSGLNRPAVVTLHSVYPKIGNSPELDFRQCLKRATIEMGAEFVDYKPHSGSLIFRVPHFSKYGLNDSDEEIDTPVVGQALRVPIQMPNQDTFLHNKDIAMPGLLNGEETIPKTALYDQFAGLDDMEYGELEPGYQLLKDLNHINKSVFIPSHQALINFDLNNERFSGMKTTFFDEDFMDDNEEIQYEPKRPPSTVNQKIEEKSVFRPLRFQSFESPKPFPLIQGESAESPLFRTPRKFLPSQAAIKIAPYEKSLLFRHRNLLLDSGCFKGSSFRVGWDSNLNFVHKVVPELAIQDTFTSSLSVMSFSAPKMKVSACTQSMLQFSKLDASSILDSVFRCKENILTNLQVQLDLKSLTVLDGVPFFTPEQGVELLNSHFRISQEQESQGDSLQDVHTVWSLCSALWGQCEEDSNTNGYNYQLIRKQLLSKWLIYTTSDYLEKEVEENHSYLSTIFSQMTGNRVADACLNAFEHKDLHLGLLLAQAGSTVLNKLSILKQLENWLQFEVDNFIDPLRLKVFALLAGKLVWKMNSGTVVNCCEDLDWKRALGLHLWFHCSPVASIQEAVDAYEESYQGTGSHGQYASTPFPPYIQNDAEKHLLATEIESPPLDMCYYLLKLYCDQSTPLGKLLVPMTYGASQLDYSLSWMVFQVLQSLGYSHLPAYQEHSLHISFASQLEAADLWEWAIFILLHIKDPLRKKAAVVEVLHRHLSLNPDEQAKDLELFITDKLGVPSCWLYAAKAVLARSLGSFKAEAWCLLKSKQWSHSHRIVIEQIAAECIIHDQFDYLKSFLMELASPEASSTILDWSTGGEVYLDYIHISEAVDHMMQGRVKVYEIEELHPKLISLSNRIINLQCQGAKSRLCQSEMSKKTVTLLRALLTLRRSITSDSSSSGNYQLAMILPKLPMPEDYALQELRSTLRSYLLEISRLEVDAP